jgi:two-component system, cell cycle sensor histidine kinase and response regulator CckA
MQAMPKPPSETAERRRRAEARLREHPPQPGLAGADLDTQRLVQELQVHQIELEMQNEELQKARDTVESSLEKYSDLYDFAPVGYLTLDREGTIQEVNLAGAGLLGIDRSRLLKRRFQPYVTPTDLPVFHTFLKTVFQSKTKESCDLTLLHATRPSTAVRIEATLAASGRECRAVLTDMTERKRAEEDRLILSKLESTGILAGGIAHDFNNLLTVILLDVELAQGFVSGHAEYARYLEDAKATVLTARGLTQQLIAFAEGGTPTRKPTRLTGLIQEAVRAALSGSRVRCEFDLADDLWLVEADEDQIGQVIRNMVLNAREAMPEGGSISVNTGNLALKSPPGPALLPGDYVRISITDRGGGIAEENLPRIYDPYFSTKRRGVQKGMGLGLTICHTIVQKHGGTIITESDVGVGTTFHIHLPACSPPTNRKLPRNEQAPAPHVLPPSGRILVMDDEDGVREVMGAMLERMGFEVEVVADGAMAVEAYKSAQRQERSFHAVILDLTVRAGMGGTEAMRTLLEIDPAVKAIVMSGYTDDPVLLDPERHGFKGVMAKPFTGDNLRMILARVMKEGGRRGENKEQRTANNEQRTMNSEQRTANSEQRTGNRERRAESGVWMNNDR